MRRGTVIIILVVALLLSGAICLLISAGGNFFRSLSSSELAALTLFFLAGVAGIFGQIFVRKSVVSLTSQVMDASTTGSFTQVNRSHPDLTRLADAINEVIGTAEEAVSNARLGVKELEIQLKVATAERQHAEAIIYSISDAVLVTDPFDQLVLANESAARTFNFDLNGSTRAPVDQVLRDPKMIELIRDMRQSHSKTGRRIVEHQVRTPLGERVFKVTLSCVADQSDQKDRENIPTLDRNGEHKAGVVAVLHDMTREKEVAEMKNDFVSNVSHELRTPLASIKAYVEMLVDGEAEDERTRQEFYEVIQNEANRLSRLIDNILNISRIESGLVKINKQPQSLGVILKDAIDVISPQARSKKIELVEKLTPIFYQTVADRDMLYQAVLNLLSNAVKYTPENGRIVVDTSVDEAKKRVITRISDTGVGIPPKDLPFVFDKFYRAEANNHMAKGTGLGLSLVKHIIETVHKGRLFVESNVDKGSCFGFELSLCD
jgi:two-component system, OmpR family, phosphate regulon sensor histidine kinase PhoR